MSETCRVRRGEGYEACDDEARRRCGAAERSRGRHAKNRIGRTALYPNK